VAGKIVAAPTARVWERYGQLRIYVSAGDRQLGWYDPRSGRAQLSDPAMEAEFWSAIRAECQRLEQEGRLSNVALPPVPPGTALSAARQQRTRQRPARTRPAMGAHWIVRDPQWDDLARNQPGASARSRARELRAEHPLMVAAAKALGIRTEAASFAAGAQGERLVGRKLNRWAARHGWHVLHAVPVGRAGADIDHVVIASFGVVTVNTKATTTRVWVGEYGMTVGGKSVDYLRKSHAEGLRAARLLSRAARFEVPVQPVIVFTGARRFSVRRGGPPGVAVLGSPRALRRWLAKQPAVLAADQVAAVYHAARQPATWQARRTRGN
jgi:hypothetical protein